MCGMRMWVHWDAREDVYALNPSKQCMLLCTQVRQYVCVAPLRVYVIVAMITGMQIFECGLRMVNNFCKCASSDVH